MPAADDLRTAAAARHRAGDFLGAAEKLSQAIALAPDNAALHCDLAVLWQLAGRLEQARLEYLRATQLDPAHRTAWYNLGWTYSQQRQYEKAAASYSQAIALKPDNFRALMNRGVVYCDHLKQYDRPIADFTRAAKIERDNAAVYFNLGRALEGKGRLDDAIAALQKSTRLQQDDDKAQNILGNVLFARGRMDEAIDAYRQAIRIKKEDASCPLPR